MNDTARYALMLVITYALLFFLVNADFSAKSRWSDEAAPWLGEPPNELSVETVRANLAEETPITVFTIPASDEWKQKIISAYGLERSIYADDATERYVSLMGLYPIYPKEKTYLLEPYTSSVHVPWLKVHQDGSMSFCPNDYNEYRDPSGAEFSKVPHPEYRENRYVHFIKELTAATLCFLLPGLFCCIGWLWVQRRPIQSRTTVNICLLLPVVVGIIGALVDFYIHGFSITYCKIAAIIAAFSNALCALVLITITAAGRWLWQRIRPKATTA